MIGVFFNGFDPGRHIGLFFLRVFPFPAQNGVFFMNRIDINVIDDIFL